MSTARLKQLTDSVEVAKDAEARGVPIVDAFREFRQRVTVEDVCKERADITAEIDRNIAKHQLAEEDRLEQCISQYLTHNPRYAHGGLSNLLTTVARIWENLHHDNWWQAEKVYQCAADIEGLK